MLLGDEAWGMSQGKKTASREVGVEGRRNKGVQGIRAKLPSVVGKVT